MRLPEEAAATCVKWLFCDCQSLHMFRKTILRLLPDMALKHHNVQHEAVGT